MTEMNSLLSFNELCMANATVHCKWRKNWRLFKKKKKVVCDESKFLHSRFFVTEVTACCSWLFIFSNEIMVCSHYLFKVCMWMNELSRSTHFASLWCNCIFHNLEYYWHSVFAMLWMHIDLKLYEQRTLEI